MTNPHTYTTDAMKTTSVCDPNIANENLEYLKYAADNIFVPADTTIYVATTGNDTTGDGTSLKPFATLQKALDYLNGKTLLGAVTIQLADGTYTHTTVIDLTKVINSHFLCITGTSQTGTILNFNNCNGFYVESDKGMTLQNMTINGNRSANSNYGVVSEGTAYLTNVTSKNFIDGFTANHGALYATGCTATLNTGRGFVSAFCGYISMKNCTSSSNATYGLHARLSSCMNCSQGGNSIINNTNYGVYADGSSRIDFSASTNNISGNTGGAIIAMAVSTVHAIGATVSGALSPSANTEGNVSSFIYR